MKDTPIFICTKDRGTFLSQLILRLMCDGLTNIILVDTGSTHASMEQFLAPPPPFRNVRVSCQVDPHLALWSPGLLEAFDCHNRHFVYTDCDVVPDDTCPADWLERLYALLDKYPRFPKAGLGLRTDDLPDCYNRKQEVIEWEKQFMAGALEPDVFDSAIDTTLALYRPGTVGNTPAIRTGGKYMARHLPWYSDSQNLSEEEQYYKAHMQEGVGHWR